MSTLEQDAPLVDLRFQRPPATLNKSAQDALATAKAYVFDSPEKKSVEAQRTSITGPMNTALKAVNAHFKAPMEWLEQAESILKRGMLAFQQEEQRKQREEQARRDREAAAARARIEAEAAMERARSEKEAQALLDQAQEAEKAGDVEGAARLATEAESRQEQASMTVTELKGTKELVSAASVERTVPKVSGISTKKVWKVEVTDKLAFVRYIAEHPEYLELVEPNTPAINKLGLALKKACPLEGVRVFEEETLASRSK
jgi:hypothetical protein